jgi:hypothetical protein
MIFLAMFTLNLLHPGFLLTHDSDAQQGVKGNSTETPTEDKKSATSLAA